MRDQVRLLGILNIAWSSIGIVIGLGVLVMLGGLAGVIGVAGMSSTENPQGGLLVAPFMALIGVVVAAVILVVSLPALIGGLALMKFKPWSRVFMIVISILHLINFPIGTALGVYGLWVLFHEDVKRIFAQPGVYVPPAPPASPPVGPIA